MPLALRTHVLPDELSGRRVATAGSRKAACLSFAFVVALSAPLAAWAQAVATAPAAARSAAPASTTTAVTVELTQFKVERSADGKEQFTPASAVKPGDFVEYRATYRNRSGQTVSGLMATLPIPDGMQYQLVSARSPGVAPQAATADGQFAAEPLMRTVRRPDGSTVREPVPAAEYRLLRWSLGQLPAGASVVVQARAQVIPLPEVVSASSAGAAGARARSALELNQPEPSRASPAPAR